MTRRRNTVLGLILITLVAAIIVWGKVLIKLICPACFRPPATGLYVYGGYRYFGDPEIKAILLDRYGLDITGEFKKGTFAMADDYDAARQPVDCIFPGSKIGIEYFNEKHPQLIKKAVVAAQDRIVLYAWKQELPALEGGGLAYNKGSSWYVRMKPLVDAMFAGQKWGDIGVGIPGYVRVAFTDPLKSSSGLQWMAFAGTYLIPGNEEGGSILTVANLQANPVILQQLYQYWEAQGAQVGTTGDLFPQFVASGAGIPLIVAYESSFTDWYYPLPADQQALAANIVGLYPEFTVNIEHTLASLTPACTPLLTAINDPEIQHLAWKKHGLYPQGYMPSGCPPGAAWCALTVPYVPEPKKSVTEAIQAVLGGLPISDAICLSQSAAPDCSH